MRVGQTVYIEDGNGFLPDAWYGDRCVVLKVVGCFVIFERAMDGNVYALPDCCLYPSYEPEGERS